MIPHHYPTVMDVGGPVLALTLVSVIGIHSALKLARGLSQTSCTHNPLLLTKFTQRFVYKKQWATHS